MPLTPEQATERAGHLSRRWMDERIRLDKVDRYLRGEHDRPYMPPETTDEFRLLVRRSVTNVVPLVVDVLSQGLAVDGYRPAQAADNASAWGHWQANGLDRRQESVHRAAIAYGTAYVVVTPGGSGPVVRGASPRLMAADYAAVDDDWPTVALHVVEARDMLPVRQRLYDDELVHEFAAAAPGGAVEHRGAFEHGLGVCPVVRFNDHLDLEGRAVGQVEPLMTLQDRLNQTVLDLLLTQTYSSWKVRTVAGIDAPEDPAARASERIKLAQNRLLTASSPDTRFGTLDETPLGGVIEAVELVVRQIAIVAQVPPHNLLGQMVNIAAEALAAAESGKTRKQEGFKGSFGESWEQTLRLSALASGDEGGAADTSSQVSWRDTESRSLSQVADALGKLADQLGIPPQALWDRVPGWTDQDTQRALALLADQGDPMGDLISQLDRQASPVLDPEDAKKRADTFGVLIRAGVTQASAAQLAGLRGAEFLTGAVPSGLRLQEDDAAGLEQT